jgi:glycosyltransferase involved in cell wall biosynthesis
MSEDFPGSRDEITVRANRFGFFIRGIMTEQTRKHSISIVTYGGWFNTFQRPHHFARYLTNRFNTNVVNNIVGLPFRGYGYMAEQKQLVDKISNIYILKEGDRFPLVKSVNNILIKLQSHFKYRMPEFRESEIIYTWHIEDINYLRHCREKFLIYDAMDDWAAFSEKIDQRLIDNENELVARADIVLAVSRKLYEKHRLLNKNTYLVPNGVDTNFFAGALTFQKGEGDPLYRYKDRPIAGYVGGIHDWVDVELIVETAKLRKETLFVLIGPALRTLKPKFEGVENILYLGPKPYSELLRYVSYFDVGIIPFKLNLLNESTNPIKLYEYLGAGLPVVSTGMREVRQYAADGIVTIADDPVTFSAKIAEAIALADNPLLIKERLKIAEQNSWKSRAEMLLGLIETKFGSGFAAGGRGD